MTGGERTLSSEDAADRIPRLVLTALAALFLVAGSTYLWRSKKSRHGPAPDILKPVSSLFDTYSIRQESGSSPGEISQLGGSPETVGHIEDATAAPVDDGMSKKSTRSKDRRRRGKDPLKDAFKKGKSSLRLPKPAADDDQGTNSNSAIASRSSSSAPMSAPHVESVEVSDCPASPPARKNKGKIMSTHGPCQESKVEGFTNADSIQEPNARISMHQATSVAVPTVEPRIEAAQKYDDSTTFSNATTSSSDLHDLEADYFGTGVQEAFGVCLSPSSASNCDSTSETHSHSTKDTSPPPSLVHDAPNDYLPPSQSMPSNLSVYVSNDVPSLHSPRPRKSSKSSVQNLQGPWDWDGQSHPHSPSAHTSYIKPPRFRSQAKHSQASGGFMARLSSSVSCTLPYLDPYSPSPSHSPPPLESPDVHTSSDARDTSMDAPTFTFPTLNAPSASPSPSSASSHQSGHGYKPTTPSRSSSSQSQSPLPNNTPVSTNTQLASLRGALEAARQREEKSKQRADKLSRDSETLKRRWGEEVVAWRRRESELQAQINHLTGQLQAYASLFVSMSNHHAHNPNITVQPYHAPTHSTSVCPPFAVPLQPVLMTTSGHSPSFGMYYTQQPGMSPGGGGSGSGGSAPPLASISASSSVASLSPVDTSPRVWTDQLGRKKMRAQAPTSPHQTNSPSDSPPAANAQLPGKVYGEEPGWKVEDDSRYGNAGPPPPSCSSSGLGSSGDEVEVSGLLADAILKRPESLGAKLSDASKAEGADTVFTFPSLSNFVAHGEQPPAPDARQDSDADHSQSELTAQA